jgi:hypothetical protein
LDDPQPEAAMTAPPSGVTVRMYRQGLGDCFLLAFATGGARPCYVLIDCGVLVGTADAEARMRQVAENVRVATGGRIDVLVATHQHWDHLSGFEQAREVFDQIEIGQVWVAWTEDPENGLAARLRGRRDTAVRALTAAARSLRVQGGDERADALDAVLGFFGELGADGRPSGLQRALEYVLGRGKPPRYRVPGEPPVPLPGVAGARVYVLGPPQDESLLLRSDPSRQASEVYESRLPLDEETAFYAAALAEAQAPVEASFLDSDEDELTELSLPFDRVYQVCAVDAQQEEFFQKHYYGTSPGTSPAKAANPANPANPAGPGTGPGSAVGTSLPSPAPPAPPPAGGPDLSWRRIDDNWLSAADNLALQLDSDTNNTSLALAIEISPGGKVLLFPGDAQVGNWLSWHDAKLHWPNPGDPQSPPVTAADLLRRTALYKVGHHGSHNATLRDKGLELMEQPDLVALLPVDEAMAHRPKGRNPLGWDMPFAPLLDRLRRKTGGRILRADSGAPTAEDLDRLNQDDREAFERRRRETALYVEVTVEA